MAIIKAYDLVVVVETYTDKQGQKKNKYENVGEVLEKDDGGRFIVLKRTFNPAGVPNPEGKANLLISMFVPKDQQQAPSEHQQQKQNGYQKPAPAADDSEISF